MENTKYGNRRKGRWTPIRVKAQDTRANPNSWETHQVRKRWDIGLLRALSLRIMMMMMIIWSGMLYGSDTWIMRKEDFKRLEAFEMWIWRRMDRISWMEHRTN